MGLLDDLSGAVKRQWSQGEPYRVALGGLLSGDTQPAGLLFNTPQPIDQQQAVDAALAFSPMGLGMIKPKVPFKFIRNTEKSPHLDDLYGQHIEPAGRYMLEDTIAATRKEAPQGWESGAHTFDNPLFIEWGKGGYADPTNWKQVLHKKYGGKKGEELSKAIAKDGYDGIVTTDKYGTSEIVDLTHFFKK